MSSDPPYLRIASELRTRIERGELRPGERVPSVRQVAEQFDVALATATRALTTLVREGVLIAVPRVGTVVATPVVQAPQGQSRPRPAPPSEGRSTRERIVQAGIRIADNQGLDAVSMRSIAAELDLSTMSLYRYVANKEDLVLWMTDAVFGESALPASPPDGWRPRLALAARLQWALYRRHPWLSQVITLTRPLPIPNLVPHGEWALAAVDGLGLDAETMLHVHMTLFGYVRGLAMNLESEAHARAETGLDEAEWMDAQAAAFAEIVTARGAPTFARVVAELSVTGYDLDLDRLFEFGLEPLLDGFERLITARR
jgi:AcrR family transcriptional regulator